MPSLVNYILSSDAGKYKIVDPEANYGRAVTYLNDNINHLVKIKPTLGATKFNIASVIFFDRGKFIAEFEDGHINGYLYGYCFIADNVSVTPIEEIVNQSSAKQLVNKYNLAKNQVVYSYSN